MKNKTTAALFAIFLGGFGAHKFYLGQSGQGILYLLFCWTMIPLVLSIIDFIKYLTMDEEKFNKQYNGVIHGTSHSKYDSLSKLSKLRDSGAISEAEFQEEKNHIMEQSKVKQGEGESFSVKQIIVGVCAIIAGIIVYSAINSDEPTKDGKVVQKVVVNPPTISLEEFNTVKVGMGLAEIENIIGSKGTTVAEDASGILILQWMGKKFGSNASITLIDGKVSSKAQALLD